MHLAHLPDVNLSHIIKEQGDLKSLCNRTCWPGTWERTTLSEGAPLCVACLRVWQTTHPQHTINA